MLFRFSLNRHDGLAWDVADRAGASATVNKRDLAALLGISVPTLDRWIVEWPMFPVVQRGDKGRAWSFDPDAARAFVAGQLQEERRREAEREAGLDAFDLPVEDGDGDKARVICPADRLTMARLARLHREEAERAGRLMPVTAVEAALTEGLPELLRSVRDAVRAWCVAQGVPADETRLFDSAIARAWTAKVRELQARFCEQDNEEVYLTS